MAVDDDPLVLDALQSLLSQRDLEVVTEGDRRLVMARLPQIAPHLLILDIDMPHMDGIELCRRIRATADHGRLRILFLTTHTDAETVEAVFRAGADGHLSKPLVVAELMPWL